MEGACDCIYNPLMGLAYPSFTMIGPQIAYRQNTICFGTLSVHWMEWCTTRRDIHCLWSVSEPFLGTSWSWGGLANSAKHLQATCLMCLTVPFSSNVYSPIAHKTADFWYPSSMANELLYCGERYPLLMKCSKSLFRYMKKIWGASGSICKLLMDLIMPFWLTSNLKLHTKYKDVFTYLLGMVNGMMHHE